MTLNTNKVVFLNADDDPEIVPDRRKLAAGAAAIRDKFSPEQRKEICNAKKLDYTDAMVLLNAQGKDVAMQDINLAKIIAGLEKAGESEVTITNMLNTMRASWPQLNIQWLKDLRKAVLYLLGSQGRAKARGRDTNIVNEHDFLHQCGYAMK